MSNGPSDADLGSALMRIRAEKMNASYDSRSRKSYAADQSADYSVVPLALSVVVAVIGLLMLALGSGTGAAILLVPLPIAAVLRWRNAERRQNSVERQYREFVAAKKRDQKVEQVKND